MLKLSPASQRARRSPNIGGTRTFPPKSSIPVVSPSCRKALCFGADRGPRGKPPRSALQPARTQRQASSACVPQKSGEGRRHVTTRKLEGSRTRRCRRQTLAAIHAGSRERRFGRDGAARPPFQLRNRSWTRAISEADATPCPSSRFHLLRYASRLHARSAPSASGSKFDLRSPNMSSQASRLHRFEPSSKMLSARVLRMRYHTASFTELLSNGPLQLSLDGGRLLPHVPARYIKQRHEVEIVRFPRCLWERCPGRGG